MFLPKKIKSLFERYTEWTEYLLLVLTIFTCTFFVYKGFGLRMIYGYAIMGMILAVSFWRRCFLKRCILKISPTCIFYLLWIGVIFLAFCRPDSRHDSDTFSYIISMVICSAYVVLSEPKERELRISLKVLMLFSVVLSIYIIFFKVFPNLYWETVYKILSEPAREMAAYYVPRGYGIPIGGSYTFADYLLNVAIAFLIGYLCTKPRSKWKLAGAILSIFLFLFCVFIIGRRGEFLATVAACLTLYFLYSDKKQFKKKALVFSGVLVSCIILFVALYPFIKSWGFMARYINTFERLFSGTDITSGRTELWQIAIDLFKQKPLFGIGWGKFAENVPEAFNAVHGGSGDVLNVHNNYLQFLCETGIVGAILIITPLVYFFVQTLRQTIRIRQKNSSDMIIILNMTALGVQAFFLFVGVLDMSFYHYKYWCFYGLAIIFFLTALKMEGYKLNDFLTKAIKSAELKFKGLFKKKGK